MADKLQYRVNPLNAKEKTRIDQHGELWESCTMIHVHYGDRKLLQSVKTGYVRWWKNESLNPPDQSI